jgi:hypothetical protein
LHQIILQSKSPDEEKKKRGLRERKMTHGLAVGHVFSSSSAFSSSPWVCWPTVIFSGVRVIKSPED